jgi:homopolymeric O-antigen transport system permease protein
VKSNNLKGNLTPLNMRDHKGAIEGLRNFVQNLRRYSYLFQQLVKVNVTHVYRRSFIGLSWLVLAPIISVLGWILLHGAGIFVPGETEIPYPAYVLLSTSIWSFFIGSFQVTSNVITNNTQILVTAKFPHEILVLESIVVHCIQFVVPFLVNVVVLMIYGVKFHWIAIIFPITLLPLLLVGAGLGMIVALLRVVAVDISRFADHSLLFLMFITPVIYSPNISLQWLADIVKYNPLTYLIGFSRDILTKGTFYEFNLYLITSFCCLIFFIFCFRIFLKFEKKLIERLINV